MVKNCLENLKKEVDKLVINEPYIESIDIQKISINFALELLNNLSQEMYNVVFCETEEVAIVNEYIQELEKTK